MEQNEVKITVHPNGRITVETAGSGVIFDYDGSECCITCDDPLRGSDIVFDIDDGSIG